MKMMIEDANDDCDLWWAKRKHIEITLRIQIPVMQACFIFKKLVLITPIKS